MTIDEQIEFEKTLGRRATQQEIREEETRRLMEIKAFANNHGYTDVHPFEVIRTISPICVEVRAMRTVQTKFPQEFHVGGFVGHYADNYGGQDYDYFQDETQPIIRIRWSRAKRQWQGSHGRFYMSDKPYKFYDYNF
jgi:hypothetical protein